MLFDPRMRGFGKGRRKGTGRGKRDEQEILTWDAGTNRVDGGNDAADMGMSTSEEPQMQSQCLASPALSTTGSDSNASGDTALSSDPSPTDMPCFSASSTITTQPTDNAWETPLVATAEAETTTTADNDLQMAGSGSSAQDPQSSSITNEYLSTVPIAGSSPISVARNTWITATTAETLSSGVTIVPLITVGGSASKSHTTPSTTTASLDSRYSNFYSSASHSSALALSSAASSTVSTVPHSEHMEGTKSSETTGIIAGVTVGAAVLILVILLSIFAYVRGGMMRGLSLLPIRSRQNASSAPVNQSRENFLRGETTDVRPRDLENATVTSGSHYDDEEDWQEVDMRDAWSGKMEYDNGEWLESWRRGKERMATTRRAPELQFNPDLPLPPINWEGTRRARLE